MTLTLQGTESKTLSIIFTPNFPKAAAGKIIFSHYSSVRESRQVSGLVKVVSHKYMYMYKILKYRIKFNF
jgi:hypothetical protein